jgi:hypothetical protein
MNDFDDIYSGFSGTRGLFPKMKYYRDVPAFMPKKEQGRNEKCKCGSGLKYKKCCGRDTVPDSERMPKRIKSEPIEVKAN